MHCFVCVSKGGPLRFDLGGMGTSTPRDCKPMAQRSLGSLLWAKSCSTHIFWAERLLVCSQAQIISDTQIHLHGCHTGSCPHLGTPGRLLLCLQMGCVESWAGPGSSHSLSCTELFLERSLLLHRFSQLTSVDPESVQPMGLILPSELTMNRFVLKSSSVLAGQGGLLVLTRRADQRQPAECHTLGLTQNSSSWTLTAEKQWCNTGNEAGCAQRSGFCWKRCRSLEMALL